MDIKTLRAFIAVASSNNFSVAAKKLHITQPTVSRIIADLEKEIDVKLFSRTTHEVRLTEAGNALLPEAVKILDNDSRVTNYVKEISKSESMSIKIGYLASACLELLPPLVRGFSKIDPNISISLAEMTTKDQENALLDNSIDIGFSRPIINDLVGSHNLYNDQMVAMLPDGHPLSNQKSLSLKELESENIILFKRKEACDLYDNLILSCEKSGFSPKITCHSENMRNLITLVSSGLGVSIVPSCIKHINAHNCQFTPIDNLNISLPLNMHYKNRNRATHILKFIDHCKNRSSQPC